MKTENIEIRRYSTEALDKIATSGISVEFVFNNTDVINVINNLDYDDDLATSKFCFRILSTFMKNKVPREKIMSVADEIMPYIVKTLESHLELNEMGQCIKVMSVFARNKAIRKKMLMYKQDVLMAKLLKKIFDFS